MTYDRWSKWVQEAQDSFLWKMLRKAYVQQRTSWLRKDNSTGSEPLLNQLRFDIFIRLCISISDIKRVTHINVNVTKLPYSRNGSMSHN